MPPSHLLERCRRLIGHTLSTYTLPIFCCCLSLRSRGTSNVSHSSSESLENDSQNDDDNDEEINPRVITTENKNHSELNGIRSCKATEGDDRLSSSESTISSMNSTESPSNGHGSRAGYPTGSYNRRYTEPYRSARPSQSNHTSAYRSISTVSDPYRRTDELPREVVSSHRSRQTVSPDLSLNSNFEAMNITNGSISPASSTFTLSSQIVSHDFDFTVARLRFVLDYTFHMSKLTTTINKVELTNEGLIKDKEAMEIDLVLLPDKRQSHRIKSKNFTEPHAFYIYPRERLPQMKLRFRLYENGRMLKRVLLAEGVLALKTVRLGFELITLDIEMFPPTRGLAYGNRQGDRSLSPVSISTDVSSMRMTHEPELLVSLQHRPSVQRLNVEILKTRCCENLVHNKAVSMYVEIKLISSQGDLLFDTKTATRRDSPNPEFNEKFSFFLPDNNLLSVTLLVTLLRVSRPFGRKSLVGRFSIGRNNSDKSEEQHWNEVVSGGDGGPVLKWHKLFRL